MSGRRRNCRNRPARRNRCRRRRSTCRWVAGNSSECSCRSQENSRRDRECRRRRGTVRGRSCRNPSCRRSRRRPRRSSARRSRVYTRLWCNWWRHTTVEARRAAGLARWARAAVHLPAAPVADDAAIATVRRRARRRSAVARVGVRSANAGKPASAAGERRRAATAIEQAAAPVSDAPAIESRRSCTHGSGVQASSSGKQMLLRQIRPPGQSPQLSVPPQLSPIMPQKRAASVVHAARSQLTSDVDVSKTLPSESTIGGIPGGGGVEASGSDGGGGPLLSEPLSQGQVVPRNRGREPPRWRCT